MLVLGDVLTGGTDLSTETGKVSNTTRLQSEASCYLKISTIQCHKTLVISVDLPQVKTEEKRLPSLLFCHGK